MSTFCLRPEVQNFKPCVPGLSIDEIEAHDLQDRTRAEAPLKPEFDA
ncbi:hypothetical protein [Desulfovibrio aminophilus]